MEDANGMFEYRVYTHPEFVVPDAASALIREIGIAAVAASWGTPFPMIPDFLGDIANERNSQAHTISTADSSDTMDVIRFFIG